MFFPRLKIEQENKIQGKYFFMYNKRVSLFSKLFLLHQVICVNFYCKKFFFINFLAKNKELDQLKNQIECE